MQELGVWKAKKRFIGITLRSFGGFAFDLTEQLIEISDRAILAR